MVTDGNGHSKIIAIYQMVSETVASLSQIMMLTAFKWFNEAWPRTTVIMFDKDVTERRVLAVKFPTTAKFVSRTALLQARVFAQEDGLAFWSVRHHSGDSLQHGPCQVSPGLQYTLCVPRELQQSASDGVLQQELVPIKQEWATCFKTGSSISGSHQPPSREYERQDKECLLKIHKPNRDLLLGVLCRAEGSVGGETV